MADEMFGLTPEARYYIDTAAEKAATAAVRKFIGQPCPFECKDVGELKDALYGPEGSRDGGVKGRTITLEEQVSTLVWQTRLVAAATISSMIGLVISITLGG